MIVDFSKITLGTKEGSGTPVVEGAYDPTWGYYVFGQTVRFDYEGSEVYTSRGEFTVRGVFTVNAEFPPEDGEEIVEQDDGDAFDAIKAKYDNLEGLFKAASLSNPPASPAEYGKAADSRCVALPGKLMGGDGKAIYARPVSLSIGATQWPISIEYSASLEEVDMLGPKLTLNDTVIDGGVLVINARRPMTRMQGMAFANSSDVYFGGWEPRTYNLTGNFPHSSEPGSVGSLEAAGLYNTLETGRISIGAWTPPAGEEATGEGVYSKMFSDLFLDNSNLPFNLSETGQGTRVLINAKE
jgi:hypothetical protein